MKEKRKRKQKKIFNYIIIITIASIIIWVGLEEYKDSKIEEETQELQKNQEISYSTQNIGTSYTTNKQEKSKIYPKEEIINEYKGYTVAAKLRIPAIDLETYILEKYSIDALNVSVTKFWGAGANEIGNFCVAGHNFQNKNMFRNLKELEAGNRLTISDNHIGKIEYEIYNIYKVDPKDVSCLSQETKGKREVTLITCTSDSSQRIIVKARETE